MASGKMSSVALSAVLFRRKEKKKLGQICNIRQQRERAVGKGKKKKNGEFSLFTPKLGEGRKEKRNTQGSVAC